MTTVTDTDVAVLGEVDAEQIDDSDDTEQGEVITPLDRLTVAERIITKGLKAFGDLETKVAGTKEEVGQALYEIYTDKLWKARKGKDGKTLYKNFGEYLEAKGWGKTTSRAFQLMRDHRKVLEAENKPVVAATRGPKPINPGRSAQTFANMLVNLRNNVAQRAEAMSGEDIAQADFIDIAERFAEATAPFISEWESLADRERGRAEAEKAE